MTPDDPRHGTNNGYQNLGCRCELCKDAQREYNILRDAAGYHRDWSHRTGRSKPMSVHLATVAAKHGTESKYTAGCRCVDCRTAAAVARRARRKRGMVLTHNASGYKNGCRCDVCRTAILDLHRRERAAS